MSSVSGLDQLCAAACDRGLQPAGGQPAAEIKVIELDAYATVADLIHAAVSANDGAAALKEIYEVCEKHGRIAYRRADGSRLITTNDHWKSQVRHALYTGGRFERVPSNGDFWQLAQAHRGTTAELVKVLVRADDPTTHIRASNTLPASTGRGVGGGDTKNNPANTTQPSTARQRRKRAMASGGGGAGSAVEAGPSVAEAFCDSADHGTTSGLMPQRFSARKAAKQRTALFEAGPLDNHSTKEEVEDGDEVHELPASVRRGSRRAPWRGSTFASMPEGSHAAPSQDEQLSGLRHGNNTLSRNSNDPSSLRWGSTALRSTIIIAADSTLSAGRTPIVRQPTVVAKARAGSAEADSAPFHNWPARGQGPPQGTEVGEPMLSPRAKRQARQTPQNQAALPTPMQWPWADMAARSTPLFMAQWADAMQQATMARQHAAGVDGGAQHIQGSLPSPNFAPFGMMPSYLPGMLASATAPFVGGQQQAPFDLQKQLEAFFLSSQAANQQMQQPMQQQQQQQQQPNNGTNVGQYSGEAPPK